MEDKKYDWLYGAAGSEYNGVSVRIIKNMTIQEMKEYLVSEVECTRDSGDAAFEDGSLKPEDIEERKYYKTDKLESLYAWADFYDFHCDYEAWILNDDRIEE